MNSYPFHWTACGHFRGTPAAPGEAFAMCLTCDAKEARKALRSILGGLLGLVFVWVLGQAVMG